MRQNSSCIRVDGRPMTTSGINLIARFVRIARTSEHVDLHLYDKGLFREMEHLAGNTADARLIDLYSKIKSEMIRS